MVAQLEWVEVEEPRVTLRLVEPRTSLLAVRRARRARSRRRRSLIVGVLVVGSALSVLGSRSLAWGGVTAAGMPTDLATGAAPSAGTVYVVAPGQTLSAVARALNPMDPPAARRALVAELGSDVVVAGEHVLVP